MRESQIVRSSVSTTAVIGWLVLFLAPSTVSAQQSPQPASKLSLEEYRRAVLAQKGDFARGQQLYDDSVRGRCKLCHAIEGKGSLIGPDLLGVGTRYDRAGLLDTILEPSAKIHPDYAATIIVTKAGKVLTGIARQINEADVEIAVSEVEKVRVAVDDIAERKPSPISAMPAGLHEKISPKEMADLLSYLAQLKPTGTGTRQEALNAQEIPRAIDFVKFKPILDNELAFRRPVWFGAIPGRPGAHLVLEIDQGRIWLLEGEGAAARRSLFVDLESEITGGEFTGLMSLAFHPDFERNRRYFLKVHAAPGEGKAKTRENALTVNIIERKASADARTDSGEPSKVRLRIPCFSVFHHGGDLAFGPDGYLYSTMGDTGPQGDPNGHGQDLGVLWGKMFRIDVDKTDGDLPYAIPPDNPFRNRPGARPEIWASGFREIWRFSFDPQTGDLWAGEVGQNRFEEIIIVRAGENYGWNVVEGFQPYSDRYRSQEAQYVPPVFAYGHAVGPSVTGGFVYRGKKHPALFGKYVFGDYETRRVWALEQRNRKITSIVEIGRAPDHISSFGIDAEGELYVVGLDRGLIYRIDPQDADLAPATSRDIVRTSLESGEPWRYTTSKPSPVWIENGFDDQTWTAAPGAFGAGQGPGAGRGPSSVRTAWNSSDIWLRREFSFAARAADEGERSAQVGAYIFKLLIRHEGDAEVYLNGVLAARLSGAIVSRPAAVEFVYVNDVLAARLSGFVGDYEEVPLLLEAQAAIRKGKNLLAVHCRNTNGGQHIDVGIVELQKAE